MPPLDQRSQNQTSRLDAARATTVGGAGDSSPDVSVFVAAAEANGYTPKEIAQMTRSFGYLRLTAPEATEWLEAGITPWATGQWKEYGFANAAEAAEYRLWRLGATHAYAARRDGVSAQSLGRYRRLFEILAGNICVSPISTSPS